jgi:transcriptional regulator CtsR
MNIASYWNQKDMLTHLTATQGNQSGTVAYSTAQLYDSNQGISQLKRQQIARQINLLDDQITTLASESARTTDAYKKQDLNNQIQNIKFQRQGLVEQRVAIDSQLNSVNKTAVINSKTGTEIYSQRDTDAALIQNNDIALKTLATTDAYMSQAGEIYQNNINQQALAQKNLGKTRTRKAPIGGGYVLPGTGSATLGRSVFSQPVFRK